jgi:beta-glucosidase
MAAAAAKEARAVGVHQALSPDLDLARDPRWGRVEETYGEDPYLAGRLGVAYIRGMQGNGPSVNSPHLVCTAKHYAAHGSPEAGVNLAPVSGGLRDLHTTYLPPFKAAVTEAGALSVMPAYSEYDGIPASASHLLLTRILRGEWGFRGYTFSDYAAIWMLEQRHHTASSPAEAGKQALEAGMDLEAPGNYGFGAQLLELARKGDIPLDLINNAVARILRVKFLAGIFEQPYADPRGTGVIHTAAHRRLALESARESLILLKNEKNLLPLQNVRRIAVIGPNADTAQFGDYTHASAKGITPLEGIRAVAPAGTTILYAKGCGLISRSRAGFAEAVAAARRSDAAVVVIGGTSHSLGGVGWGTDRDTATCGEGFDRTELDPPGVQEDLVRAIYETGTPVVLVLVHGRPFSIAWEAEHIHAIIETWYPGEEGGRALAEIIFGRVNPSGKLPITVPRSAGHVPAFYNHKPSARGYYHKPGTPETPGRDYVFSSPAPLFDFGHGLSYTTYRYTRLRVSPKKIHPTGCVHVRVDVSNVGRTAGKEVVQLYLRDLVSSVTTPVKRLCRFEKIFLAPGRRRRSPLSNRRILNKKCRILKSDSIFIILQFCCSIFCLSTVPRVFSANLPDSLDRCAGP